ncbi:MAG: NUDIX hydrolase [Acidobacteriota bacterium]
MSDPYQSMDTFVRRVPEGDTHERLVCSRCGFIHYDNPKVIVGAVCTWEDRFLLCRRSIEPRRGYWTLPAGFLEVNETTEAGARREVMEEAGARIEIDTVLAVYDVPHVSQVQIIYRASLASPRIEAGIESAEVALFDWNDIPWQDLAFPTVRWALLQHREVAGRDEFRVRRNPVPEGERPGGA